VHVVDLQLSAAEARQRLRMAARAAAQGLETGDVDTAGAETLVAEASAVWAQQQAGPGSEGACSADGSTQQQVRLIMGGQQPRALQLVCKQL
jgi:hypothetical protein